MGVLRPDGVTETMELWKIWADHMECRYFAACVPVEKHDVVVTVMVSMVVVILLMMVLVMTFLILMVLVVLMLP